MFARSTREIIPDNSNVQLMWIQTGRRDGSHVDNGSHFVRLLGMTDARFIEHNAVSLPGLLGVTRLLEFGETVGGG